MDDFEQLQLLGSGGYASVFLVRRSNSAELFALKKISRSKIVTEQQKSRLDAERNTSKDERCTSAFGSTETLGGSRNTLPSFSRRNLSWHCEICTRKDTFIAILRVSVDGKDGDDSGRTQSVCGTHYVMAPEMFFKEPYGFSIDWWSLGVVIYEMLAGHPPWEYQCPTDSTLEEYFQRIKRTAGSPFQTFDGQVEAIAVSPDLQSLICALLQINPRERLGKNGAAEIVNHVWFNDIDWAQFETKEGIKNSIAVTYDFNKDYNAARVRTPQGQCGGRESLSSAESIDPEDNAKYFADF
ncbi:hypothetical protein PI124_g3449 [Phytophthora idaei]|nr:hypothetical protein PI125_g3045 [Phytophthora idaei]KAG3168599.1 hypothetical protein PI126_g3209 [Phytophthora idaei]KAG3251930.1 hypothetical protein PI124_g3449 [Phytophthora idaei]